ncbi:MAG: cation diffusion facilitator family transporter, partial [Nanoarchaeota archaeon]|nr:cation diffusion facilitator family transporter [Nanoarchaeota archaeon]
GHNHKHHSHEQNSVKNIKIAFFLNFFFTIIEFIGGYLTNSVAIMSDALHDLGDTFSLGLAWFLEKFSSKKRTNKFSYGYKRFSLLGAFINAVILLLGSLFILSEAIPRIINPEASNAQGMLILAIFGIIVNGYAVYKTSKGKTMNEKVISWHLLEDVLGWVAVFIVSIVMIFTNLIILDPILSILITLYILWGVLKNLKSTALLFLQATPTDLNANIIDTQLKKNPLIQDIHDTHIWSLDGEEHILSSHIVIKENSTKEDIKKIKIEIKKNLISQGINHSTLEIEFEDEICDDYCK